MKKGSTTTPEFRKKVSKAVRLAYRSGKHSSMGFKKGNEFHLNNFKEKVVVLCATCGKKMYLLPCWASVRKYCSPTCSARNRPKKANPKTTLQKRIRCHWKFDEWRETVFERDNYTCVECGKRGVDLHPHHKVEVSALLKTHGIETIEQAENLVELWDTNNGMTLCKNCHQKKHCTNLSTFRKRKLVCSNCGIKYKPKSRGTWRNKYLNHFCCVDCMSKYFSKTRKKVSDEIKH